MSLGPNMVHHSAFINIVVLKHSHDHLFTYFPRILLLKICRDEYLQRFYVLQSIKYLLYCYLILKKNPQTLLSSVCSSLNILKRNFTYSK